MNEDAHLESLRRFRDGRPPAANEAEFLDDLEDFIRQQRGKAGRAVPHESKSTWPAVLPSTVQDRQRLWIGARERRLNVRAAEIRAVLGYSSVPIPGDTELGEAFWRWMSLRSSHVQGGELSRRLSDIVRRLNPPRRTEDPDWTNEEIRVYSLRYGVTQFVRLTDRASYSTNRPIEEVALWLLCGTPISIDGITVTVDEQLDTPPRVSLTLNPNLLTPEDIRTILRRIKRLLSSRRQLRTFVAEQSETRSLDLSEKWRLWNELHPLHPYASAESFRVAIFRAKREDEKSSVDWHPRKISVSQVKRLGFKLDEVDERLVIAVDHHIPPD